MECAPKLSIGLPPSGLGCPLGQCGQARTGKIVKVTVEQK